MNNENHGEEKEPQEYYEHHVFKADKGQRPLRVDKYLFNFLENVSRNKIQIAAKSGNILVNELPVKPNHKVKPNDIVKVVFAHPPYEYQLVPQDIPVDIVYEDDSILIVNKSPEMVVHPGHGNYDGTLVNALSFHIKDIPVVPGALERPGLVHRIDKETSGLLVVAKTEIAMNKLAKQFFDKSIDRTYYAIVWGTPKEQKGTIVGNIGRDPKNRLKMTVFPNEEEGKHAITHYEVIQSFGYVSLIKCKLETGRTHQIRVHMKHIGHTLFNDKRYGGDSILKGPSFTKYKQFIQNCFEILPRQALHAKSLGFIHPESNENVFFDSELPDDIIGLIDKWKKYQV